MAANAEEATKSALALANLSVNQLMPEAVRKAIVFDGGVEKAEKSLGRFFRLRITLDESRDEPAWVSSLSRFEEERGAVFGFGSREKWRVAGLLVALGDPRNSDAWVDPRATVGDFLGAFCSALSKAKYEEMVSRAIASLRAAPTGASVEMAAGEHLVCFTMQAPDSLRVTAWPHASSRADLQKALIYMVDRCQVLKQVNDSLRASRPLEKTSGASSDEPAP
jgi:hypothetical protein